MYRFDSDILDISFNSFNYSFGNIEGFIGGACVDAKAEGCFFVLIKCILVKLQERKFYSLVKYIISSLLLCNSINATDIYKALNYIFFYETDSTHRVIVHDILEDAPVFIENLAFLFRFLYSSGLISPSSTSSMASSSMASSSIYTFLDKNKNNFTSNDSSRPRPRKILRSDSFFPLLYLNQSWHKEAYNTDNYNLYQSKSSPFDEFLDRFDQSDNDAERLGKLSR